MRPRFLPLIAPALLSACAQKAPTPSPALDERSLAKGAMDPALTSALEGPMMVDPTLADMANRDAVKPADAPETLLVPNDETPRHPAQTRR